MTAEFAPHCDELIAVDGVAEAVIATRAAAATFTHVCAVQARLPAEVPDGPFDLALFSEVLYYLDEADLCATLAAVEDRVGEGGELLAVDWPATHDAARDADDAHSQLVSRRGWEVMVEHAEPTFLLHVLRRK